MTARGKLTPWGLSAGMVAALDALAAHGRNKGAARALGISPRTIEAYLADARNRIAAVDGVRPSTRAQLLAVWIAYRARTV